MGEKGVIVGSDAKLQWLLPWWWEHYTFFNSFPVCFMDFGMSKEAAVWCKERGSLLKLPRLDFISRKELSHEKQKAWEERYGEEIWSVREAWLKKPLALLNSPFSLSLWLDLDCQVKGPLDNLFNSVGVGVELALARDREQKFDFLLPGEVNYNSGVILWRKETKIIQQWAQIADDLQGELPGDQELLNRAIFLHRPALFELPSIYNWYHVWGPNEKAIIEHFCGGMGKIQIYNNSTAPVCRL